MRCNDAVVVLTKQHPILEDVSRSLVLGEHFFVFLRHLCGVKTWEGGSHPRVEAFWDPDPSRKDAGVEPRKDQARRVRQFGTGRPGCTEKTCTRT